MTPATRDALLLALGETDVISAARRLGVDLNTAYAWDSRRLRNRCVCGAAIHRGSCTARVFVDREMAASILAARVGENLSRAELAARFPGIPAEAISRATRGHPYRGRRSPPTHDWTAEELAALRRLYPAAAWWELRAALPRRGALAISRKASELGIRRESPKPAANKPPPEILALRARRLALGLTVRKLIVLTGLSGLGCYETGWVNPPEAKLQRWGAVLSSLERPSGDVPTSSRPWSSDDDDLLRVLYPRAKLGIVREVSDDHRYPEPPRRPLEAVEPPAAPNPPKPVTLTVAPPEGFSMLGKRLLRPRVGGPVRKVELSGAP